jgi:hypothetical protein
LETNISYKVANTKIYRESKELKLEFLYETGDAAYFCLDDNGFVYYLVETFTNGKIMVLDENSHVYHDGNRILNLLRLKI